MVCHNQEKTLSESLRLDNHPNNHTTKKIMKRMERMKKYWLRYLKERDSLIKEFSNTSKADIARLAFDTWASRYSSDMKAHTDAAIEVLRKVGDIIPPYAREGKELMILDPSVGTGEVTEAFVYLIKMSVGDSNIRLILHANDISEKMMKIANKRFNIFPAHFIVKTTKDFLNDEERRLTGLKNESVDLILLSQTLDVIKGIEAKRTLLGICHDLLKIGGRLVVIGEDPSSFSVTEKTDPVVASLFSMLFDGIGKNETESELIKIRDGRLRIIGESMHPIDEHHSMFCKVVERIYIPSSRENEKKQSMGQY